MSKQYPKYFIAICLYQYECQYKRIDKKTGKPICITKEACRKGKYKKIISIWRLEHDGEC